MNDKYTAEQIDACILCYKSGDLNYCRQGIIDLLSSYATHLREREAAKGVPHPDDVAVDLFAFAMKEKLAEARSKGRGGWQDKDDCPQSRLSNMLRGHVEKGDPRDVANFCMFLHQRGESILPSESAKVAVTDEPRFFIDHGMIHDRVTGKHVTCDPDYLDYEINPGETTRVNNPDGISNTCALLNSLAVAPMLASALVPELENALRMCVSANAMLSEIEDGKTLYEGSPTNSTLCLLAWSNLNTAIANAKQVLDKAPKPETEE